MKMADFFADSDDEKTLKEILSQAMDMAILEQVAAINNAGRNSYLPSHLETRFQNLKHRPSSTTKPASLPKRSFNLSHSSRFKKNGKQTEKSENMFEVKKGRETMICPSSRSVSPPAKNCCFSCFRDKVSRRESNEKMSLNSGLDWRKNDEFLSDMSDFSVKNQQKMMKKALKEEAKICREAENIVKWVKHASAGMDA